MDKKCNYSQLQNPPQYRSCFERNTGSSSSECETCPNLVDTEHVNCPEQSRENIKEPLLPAVTCDERFGVKNKNWATDKSIACPTAKQPNISNVKPANKRIVKHSNDPTIKQENRRTLKESGNNIKKNPAKQPSIPSLPSYKKRKKATISHKLSPQDRNLNQFRNSGVRTNDHLNEVHNSRSAIKNTSRSLSRSRKSLSIYSIDSGLRMNLDAKGKEKNNLSSSSKIKRQSIAVAKPASGTTRPTSVFTPASGLKIDSATNIRRMESETHLKYLRSDVDAQSNPNKHKTGNKAKYNNDKLNDFCDTTAKTENTKTKNPQTYSSNQKVRKPPAKTRMKQERNIKAPSLASRLKESTSSVKPKRVSCQEREGCEPCIKESKNDGIRSRSKLSSNGSKVKIKKNKSPSKEEKSKTYKKQPKTISHTASITSSDSGSQASSRQNERKRRNQGNKKRDKSKTSALSSNSGNSNMRYISRVVSPTLKEYERRRQILKGTKGPIPKPKRNTFLDWNHDSEVFAFGKRLSEEFDKSLLQQAFTQRAYIIQEEERQKEVGIDNPEIQLRDCRELSIEGESFMRDYIHMYLEAALPKFPEPGIVSITNYLMTEEKLAHISRFLGTHDLILTVEHPVSNPVLAETFKAIVAALVHSSGTERAAHFVRDFVITQLNGLDVNELWPIEDPIGMLADILNKSSKKPEPRLIGQVGINTVIPCYAIGIFVDKELVSEGYGETVAVAHEMAARVALQEFFETTDNMRPINFRIPGLPRKANQKKLQEQMQTS